MIFHFQVFLFLFFSNKDMKYFNSKDTINSVCCLVFQVALLFDLIFGIYLLCVAYTSLIY